MYIYIYIYYIYIYIVLQLVLVLCIAHLLFCNRFASNDWISLITDGAADWELRVRGNFIYREDNGLINSSPVVNIPPLIRIQRGCSHNIKVPGNDLYTYV